jgi:hypothetical protein
MSNLKVTAYLITPLAVEGDLPHLDGILTWAMTIKKKSIIFSRHGNRHEGIHANEPGSLPIPIETCRVDGFAWPIPRCSNAIVDECRESVDKISRRFPSERAQDLHESRRVQVATTGGELKSYHLPIRVVHAQTVTWFCVGRGKPKKGLSRDGNPLQGRSGGGCEVRKLLRGITSIGDRTNIGYGRVSQWTVEPAAEDWSWFAPSESGVVLMRVLPIDMALPEKIIGYRKWFGGVVPPYWGREYYTECVQPC